MGPDQIEFLDITGPGGVQHAANLRQKLPGRGSGDPLELALLAWSMVHGIAKLATTGRLPYQSSAEIFKFAAFVIDQSLPVRAG